MTTPPTMLERAFQLAASGKCSTISDIQKALSHEGYLENELAGPVLVKQLRQLMHAAKAQTRPAR